MAPNGCDTTIGSGHHLRNWIQLNFNYKKLVRYRNGWLRAMRRLPEEEGSSQMYHAGDELYPLAEPRKDLNFLTLAVAAMCCWRVVCVVFDS